MKLVHRLFRPLALLGASCLAGLHGPLPAQEPAPSGYHLLHTVALPGPGKGDFIALDGVSRRLFVTHADSVQVLDADTLERVGTVEGVPHAHGVLALDQLGKGYATSGVPGTVVVFDLKTFKHLAEIGSKPDTDVILFDQPSGHVVTCNGDSHDATIIDPSTDKVLRFVDLGGDPEVAVSDGQGAVFDNVESTSEVIRINAKSLEIEKRWPIAPGQTPSGLAMDVKHHRLFIGCRNKLLVVMDSTNGKVLQTLPIGDHIDTTVFDPASGTVFNSCGDGTLSVVHQDSPDNYSLVENAVTEAGAKTMAFDPKTGRVFLSTVAPKPDSFHVLVLGK